MAGTEKQSGSGGSFWKSLAQKLSGLWGRGRITISSPPHEGLVSSPVAVEVSWDKAMQPGTFTAVLDGETMPVEQFTLELGRGATARLEIPSGSHTLTVSGSLSGLGGGSQESATCTFQVLAGEFSLEASPSAVAEQGQEAEIKVTLSRGGGFAGEIEVSVPELPVGVRCPAIKVPPEETMGVLTLTVGAEAEAGVHPLTVTASGATNDGVKSVSQVCRLSIFEACEFSLRFEPEAVSLEQGESASVEVLASRGGSFRGDIKVEVAGLPPGVSVSPLEVPFYHFAGVLTLRAGRGVAPGVYPLTAKAESYVNHRFIRHEQAFTLTVAERIDFDLELLAPRVVVPMTQAGEVRVAVVWTGGCQEQVTVTTSPLPVGVSVNTPLYLQASPRVEPVLTFTTGSLARPGSSRIKVMGSGVIRGKAVSHGQELELSVTRRPGAFQEVAPGWWLGSSSSPNGQVGAEIAKNPFGGARAYYARFSLRPGADRRFPGGAALGVIDFTVSSTSEGGVAFSAASTSAVVWSGLDEGAGGFELFFIGFSRPRSSTMVRSAGRPGQVITSPRVWFSPDGTLAMVCKAGGDEEEVGYQLELLDVMAGRSLGRMDCRRGLLLAELVEEQGEFRVKVRAEVGREEEKENTWVIG